MKVTELSRDELMELKARYYNEKYDLFLFEEMADSEVTDEEIFKEYEHVNFVKEDFFCNL